MSKNFPTHVLPATEENLPINTPTLSVLGSELNFREFASGYVSIGKAGSTVASKAMLNTTGKIRGFLGALATLIDRPEATIVRGFHCAMGLDKALLTWDESREPIAYVNWSYLSDEATLKAITDAGVVRKEHHGNYWVAIYAKRNRLFAKYAVIPQQWDEFTAWLRDEQGIDDPKAIEAKLFIESNYDKRWAVQNRHDGFEVALRLLAGEIFVGMEYTPANPVDAQKFERMMLEHYQGLWNTTEARTQAAEAARVAGEAARKLRRTVVASFDPEFKNSDYASASVESGKAVIFKTAGETQKVSNAKLVGKRATSVYADGSSANDATLLIKTEAHVTAILNMASSYRALIALVD